ncbi:MAG: membrane protein insertase YidC [Bacteroidales bacterium]|nr:membrane protein insertase YidC [Bacteroidales bacterium]
MNKNTITGLILIFIILIVYSLWMTPSKEEQQALKRQQDSMLVVRQVKQRIADSIALVQEKANKELQADSLIIATITDEQEKTDKSSEISKYKDKLGDFANSAIGKEKFYTLENDLLKLTISSHGGKIASVQLKDYQTYDSLPLILFTPDDTKFGFSFFANNRVISTNELFFQAFLENPAYKGKESIIISGTDSLIFAMRLYTDALDTSFNKNKYIEFQYILRGDNYMIGYNINFVGLQDIIDPGTNFLDIEWSTNLRTQEKSIDRFNGPTIYYKYYKEDVDYLSETKDDEESLKTKVKWISYKQHFFSSTLIANSYFLNADIKTLTESDTHSRYLKSMTSLIGVPFSLTDNQSIGLSFYFGPNKFKTLRKYDLALERQIPIGWSFFLMAWINRYAVIPVFDFLGTFGWNYGIIILVLTILLKTVLFPIAYKTYKSSAKMRVLKPEIDELAKKFPKKEDAMKKQQATMSLYKKAGVNPMAGCVPMLLQMPILFAMFRFFPSSIELRQQPFLWAHDLSSYDSIYNLPFDIPFYGDHVSLFTLLMTVSTILYTKVNNELMGSTSTQMPGMKMMMYIMPVMFLGIFNNYASGLSYYYLLANLITFAQMFLIRKTIDEKKILKQIQEYKKKPAKKTSGFQKRLEEMSKKRGYKPSSKKR